MRHKKLIYLAASLVAVSCTSVSEPENPSQVQSPQNYLVPVEDALATADKAFNEFYGQKASRSEKEVEGIEFFGKRTRGSDSDAYGFYIINYEDDGFAMISADKRRRQSVYGISDEGSMHLSDTLTNKGLSWYLNDYVASTDDYEHQPTPIDTAEYHPIFNTITEKVVVEPLLKGFMAKFSQHYPFNNNCPILSDVEHAVVGCVPLAVGTIMGYYEWPLSKDGCT